MGQHALWLQPVTFTDILTVQVQLPMTEVNGLLLAV